MTREEREKIKREAEEQVNVCTPYHAGSFVQGYIVAAVTWQTKYEKQKEINKELVDENEALKFAARMSEKTEKQLRNENAELKAEIENDRDLPTVAYMQGAEKQKKKDEKQLTKAKEIIKNQKELLDRVLSGAETLSDFAQNTLHKAEQFLKEIDK